MFASMEVVICSTVSEPVSATDENVRVKNMYPKEARDTDIIKSKIVTIIADTPLIITILMCFGR
jgi:hypothetical protein